MYIMKNEELRDGSGLIKYIVLDADGHRSDAIVSPHIAESWEFIPINPMEYTQLVHKDYKR